MTHIVKFYPVGNGDCSQIILDNGKRLLFDFYHQKQGENSDSSVINLKNELYCELNKAGRDSFDVVAFTHADEDHIGGSSDFFELEHAEKYKGGDRIKINELWVPAAMILEEGASGDNRVLRQEARYRLKQGKGIRVFSKPDKLKDWLNSEGLTVADRVHLITDAGSIVDGFSLSSDGVEFFCHSPFIAKVDDEEVSRNSASLILHATFETNNKQTKFMLIGDTEYSDLAEIVRITKAKSREEKLEWNLYAIPHHCSYKALSEDKGENETVPDEDVKYLLQKGLKNSYMVSSSLPVSDNNDAYSQDQPPHIQAKKCYEKYLDAVDGRRVVVTMEYPSKTKPKPAIFKITSGGCTLDSGSNTGKAGAGAAAAAISPKAGQY